ncbi:MAG: DUF72 domain-containing protein [Proteobacteria bacterium]|nr:DUF72 domain-containing protein [Pseudomonadota bacterium]
MTVRIGTAGWSIPRRVADAFPAEGTGLERYAARFQAAEINSTFYRSHRPGTFQRWAASTPDAFRFAAKLPKAITHQRRLVEAEELVAAFLAELGPLGGKLGPILVQLPPKLAFEAQAAETFFRGFRARHEGPVVCEPRHPTWFEPAADALLREMQVARAAADPAVVPEAARPGGWPGLAYHRLHGAPRLYFSDYEPRALDALAAQLGESPVETWCIFDNTASGAAGANALELQARLSS